MSVPNRFAGSGGLPAATLTGTLSEGAGGLVGVSDTAYISATQPTIGAGELQHFIFRFRRNLPTRNNYIVARASSGSAGVEVYLRNVAGTPVIRGEVFTTGGSSLGSRDLYLTSGSSGDDLWGVVEVRESSTAGTGAVRIRTFNPSGAKLQDTVTYNGTKPAAGIFGSSILLGRDTGTGADASEIEGDGFQWALITHTAPLSDAEVAAFITSGSPAPGSGVWWYGSLPDPAPAPPTPTVSGGTLGRPATRGGPGVWLLEVDLGSETLRVGTAPARPQVRAMALERVDYETGLDDFDLVSGSDRVGVRVERRDYAALRRRVGPLRGRRFRLWRWHPDLVLEDAYLAIEGVVDAATHASPEDPDGLSLTLARDVRALALTYPTSDMVVDSSTWPNADDNIRGEPYPVVVGAPGSPIASGGGAVQATPGYLVHAANHTILVAGHRVAATNVSVWNLTQGTSATLAVSNVEDGRGRVVATVDGTSGFSGATSPNAGDELVVGWNRGTWGGGLIGPEGEIVGAGDLLLWGVRHLTRGVWDLAAMSQYRAALNAYKIDTFWNDPENWEDWVQANILSTLPIEEIQGPRGRYYRPIVYETDRTRVRASIATPGSGGGRRVSRVSAVTETDAGPTNFVEVLYGGQFGASSYRRRVWVGPRRGEIPLYTGVDTRVAADFRARTSDGYYQTRMRTVHLPQTWDPSTAFAAAAFAIGTEALPGQVATYEGGDDLLDLVEYDTVEVWDTSSGADFRGDLGIVQRVEILPDGARVSVLVPWDPLRRPTVGA